MKPSLCILAAGMGSRYGGMKQIDPVGPNGAVLLDYAIYDAVKAGFGKIVFVITHAIEQGFKENFERKYGDSLNVEYAFQDLDKVPAGFTVPAERKKPWGTGHAVLIAREALKEPFAVINADDYYGASSYRILADFLRGMTPGSRTMAMVGFAVENTLSENGTVSRGVCTIDKGKLVSVVEREKIQREQGSIYHQTAEGKKETIAKGTLVSMNFWGFAPDMIFPWFEKQFAEFMKSKGTDPKAEFYLPSAIDAGIRAKEMSVEVLATQESWFGLTYSEDKPVTREFIEKKIREGVYPENLFAA
jgi:UTP-glucose-1-phosphate uridylyltransferase